MAAQTKLYTFTKYEYFREIDMKEKVKDGISHS